MDENLTVKEVVKEGVKHISDVVDAYEAISLKLAEPMGDEEMMKVIEEQGQEAYPSKQVIMLGRPSSYLPLSLL